VRVLARWTLSEKERKRGVSVVRRKGQRRAPWSKASNTSIPGASWICQLRCVWVAPGLAGATLIKAISRTRQFFALDYTRCPLPAASEICITWIHFSDSPQAVQSRTMSPFRPARPRPVTPIPRALILVSKPCHRIMHRGQTAVVSAVVMVRDCTNPARQRHSSEVP
jgi:hypothetical protein